MSRYDRSRRSYEEDAAPFRAPAPGKLPASAKIFRAARDAGGVAAGADEAVARASSSSGSALPSEIRTKFEGSLGADLSGVRVHTGAESAQAASAVGAKAYTIGNDIHFADGRYAPTDPFGIHLLAHEVAHTQQQAGGTPHRQNKLEVSSAGDAAEVDADRAADAMVAGAPASISVGGAGIQREEAEESESGTSQASFTLGERTSAVTVSKDGKTTAFTHAKELASKEFGPHPVCSEPPLFLSGSIAAKIEAGVDSKSGDDGEVESNTVSGTIIGEASGKLLLGAAVHGAGKLGLEGAITGSIKIPGKITVTKSGEIKVPEEIVAPLLVEVTLGLVGEVGEGKHKIGGALTKNLTSLKAGVITVNDSGIDFKPCTMDALAQAGKDLLWNTAETLLPGGAQIQQYEIDKKNEEKLNKSSEQDVKKSDASMHDQQVDAQNNDIGNAMAHGSTATAGMTRTASGTYVGEYSPAEKQTMALKQAEETRARVKEQYASREQSVKNLRAEAVASKGKCNKLTSGGSWDGVSKAAQAAYSVGMKRFNEGDAAWKAAQAAANDPGLGVMQFFPQAAEACSAFVESANKFKEGDGQ